MASERYHKAARDGNISVLKEATKRDCNAKDEDGMTPTMWAAFEGKFEALKLLVVRGGDPDKGDNFGNTALHHCAERGHMSCVSFLVSFGANLWSLNFEMHTPKELAAIRNRDDILRFLDEASAKEEATNRKEVKAKKEKAQKEVEKKMKEYEKLKKKADKYAELEQDRLKKERQRMGTDFMDAPNVQARRPSTMLATLRNKALGPSIQRGVPSASPRFSEIVGTVSAATGKKLGIGSVVARKAQAKKFGTTRGEHISDDFKVVEVEDGRRSIRNLTGLRRDSEVLYVGKIEAEGRRGKLDGVFYNELDDVKDEDEEISRDTGDVLLQEPASIFDRPGFGSFAFMKPITSTLSGLPISKEDAIDEGHGTHLDGESIGSAGSLVKRNPDAWIADDDFSDEDGSDSLDGESWSPLRTFMVVNGLGEYTDRFVAEKIDMEALMLLTEEDLNQLRLPIGPRRKLVQAIQKRKDALAEPGTVQDSQI